MYSSTTFLFSSFLFLVTCIPFCFGHLKHVSGLHGWSGGEGGAGLNVIGHCSMPGEVVQ